MSETSLDQLVAQAVTVKTTLSDEEAARIADLALRIAQQRTRGAGGLLTAGQQRTYTERSETERAGLRSLVHDVVTSLVLLGIIDRPG